MSVLSHRSVVENKWSHLLSLQHKAEQAVLAQLTFMLHLSSPSMLSPLSCNHLCSQGPWAPKHTWGETDSKPGAVTPWSIPQRARSCYFVVHSSMDQGQFFTLFFIFLFVNNGDGDHNLMEANGSKEESEKGKLLPRPLFPVSFWGNLQGLGERTGFLITVTVGSWGWHSVIIFQEYYILCSYWKHSHFPTPFSTHPYKTIQSF